ncbi:MAG: tetratricopeptide repeat protein [Candidatus Puniceispirillaceae bacterium]
MSYNIKATIVAAFLMLAALPMSASAQSVSDADVANLRAEAQDLLVEKQPEEALRKIEQVIIARPTDLAARFFRAQILVSLGRGAEIRDELQLMTTLNIPAADKEKARQLVAVIDKAGRRFSGTITLKAGFGYGNNVNSWPNGGETTNSSGINAALGDPVYKKYESIDDTIRQASVSFSGSYLLSEDRSLKTNFGLTTSQKEAGDTVSIDSKVVSARLGLQKDFETNTTVKVNASTTSLDRVNDKDGTAVTSDLDYDIYDLDISQKVFGSTAIGAKYATNASRNSKIANAKNSDSNTNTTSVYVGRPIGGTAYGRLTYSMAKARADLANETAKKKVNKDTNTLSALVVKVLPNDQRIIATISFSETEHLKKKISNKNRLDKKRSLTLSYNIKGDALWSRLEGFDFSVDGSMSETKSNQASARVHAKTIMLNVSRKFDL